MSGFTYEIECIAPDGTVRWTEKIENIIPTLAQNYFIAAALTGGSRYSTWYIGLYNNNYAPIASDTMLTFSPSAGEETNYSESVRQTVIPDSVANGLYSNYDNPAEFTFTASRTVRGGFICSASDKGGTGGLLLSGALFSSPRSISTDEVLRVKAGLQFFSA
jgi:hypothetical protein